MDTGRKMTSAIMAKTTKIILARCDFCERTTLDLEDGETMIASPGASSLALARAHICSECVRSMMQLLEEKAAEVRNGGS